MLASEYDRASLDLVGDAGRIDASDSHCLLDWIEGLAVPQASSDATSDLRDLPRAVVRAILANGMSFSIGH